MRYAFYTTSEKAWDAILGAIREAKRSIFIEMYIFVDDTETHHFFDILKEKARHGIKVKLILDSLGSNGLHESDIAELRAAGVELLFFSYWLTHTHKKILIVDEETAFLGGVNVSKLFRKWNDLQVKLSGPIVKNVLRSFAKSYRACGGKDVALRALGHHKLRFFEREPIRFWGQERLTRKNPLAKLYRDKLNNARESIVIVTPYFAPRRWLVGILHQAVLRGVRVEILTPRETDHHIFSRINYLYLTKLAPLGIKFYLHPEMNHAKAFLIDGREGMVGSANIDLLSFDYLLEAGAVFNDAEMVAELAAIIDGWRRVSKVFAPAEHPLSRLDRLLMPFVGIF
ncbi:MAG: phosphatidylserine/phosphatidylglycerophosphate/cardiolipin synthase family protein [Candidatus Niyogibacteria bacterium]|nr:phosphatidylserine/phosphatidylglycerophosphate/cardiolipin synthase family protein [Candidatus Niyogibacteria bacterium]